MAANPTPGPTLSLAVLDPLSADISVVCGTITSIFNFLSTPAGQKLVEAEIKAGNDIQVAATKLFGNVWNSIVGLFGKVKI